jgi:hypothetical protein
MMQRIEMVRLVGSGGEEKRGKAQHGRDEMLLHGWGGDPGQGFDSPHVGHSFFMHMFSTRIADIPAT